jgi:Protein of unknown function (DUF3176)
LQDAFNQQLLDALPYAPAPIFATALNPLDMERHLHQTVDPDPFLITNPPLDGEQPRVLHLDDQASTDDSGKKPQTGQRTHIARALIWEILSLVLAATSLLTLVAILQNYDDKENPRWALGPWGVTLNAILSIVSTAFRASLLMPVAQCINQFCWIWYTQPRPLQDICYYDSASRGPLGSIYLLFRLRFL